ncbi:MAG: hypothetical protein ABSB19_09275 [Methylomonas sp.]|jgi:hypothetical protein
MRQRDFPALINHLFALNCLVTLASLSAIIPVPACAVAVGHADHLQVQPSDDFQGDLLLFPDLTGISSFDQRPNQLVNANQGLPELNAFYTADYRHFRFLGEWLVNTQTHYLERFQLGWHLGESSLWLGRFHNPIGYWNMQYHHAAFLQSTTSRPGIMAFETQGGVLPNHLIGFLWEGLHELGEGGVYYTLGAGAGPQIGAPAAPQIPYSLAPVNLLNPGGAHRPAATFRVGYQPISYGVSEIGVSGAYTDIPAVGLAITDIKQYVATTYANWQFQKFRFLSEIVYAHNHMDSFQTSPTNSQFASAYGQLEWDFDSDWTLIGRAEGTLAKHNDPYLAYFPKFVEQRLLGGLRYKINNSNALKVELSRDETNNNRYEQVMFQWSAVFP